MCDGMFVQTHFIAEDNWLHHTMDNNALLAVAVLIAWGREMGNCHSLMQKRICVKQNFKYQNHDLSTENRRTCEFGSCCPSFVMAVNASARGMEANAGASNLFG